MTITYTKSPPVNSAPYAPAAFSEFAKDVATWLVQQAAGLASAAQPVFLVIHADDGVIWGRIQNGVLSYPKPSAWTPPLRAVTVQQCRLFGDLGELFIWREAEKVWRGRRLVDIPGVAYEVITERPYLVGDRIYDSERDSSDSRLTSWPQGFTPIIEIATGMRQIVPCAVSVNNAGEIIQGQRPRLTVLHYLHEDEDGQSLIKCSRLKHIG